MTYLINLFWRAARAVGMLMLLGLTACWNTTYECPNGECPDGVSDACYSAGAGFCGGDVVEVIITGDNNIVTFVCGDGSSADVDQSGNIIDNSTTNNGGGDEDTGDDDDDDTGNPDGDDECSNGIDDDGDGEVDNCVTYFIDTDLDGHGASWGQVTIESQTVPEGYAAVGDDCDDNEPFRSPSNLEACNYQDNDCDGQVDGTLATGEYCVEACFDEDLGFSVYEEDGDAAHECVDGYLPASRLNDTGYTTSFSQDAWTYEDEDGVEHTIQGVFTIAADSEEVQTNPLLWDTEFCTIFPAYEGC